MLQQGEEHSVASFIKVIFKRAVPWLFGRGLRFAWLQTCRSGFHFQVKHLMS